jgi:hypothetical protein
MEEAFDEDITEFLPVASVRGKNILTQIHILKLN